MWCLTYSFPSLFVQLLACSLLGWWVPMFLRRISLLEVCMSCDLSLQACSNVTLEDVAVLGECCPSGHDSSLNLLVLVFISGAISLSQVDVAFNVRFSIWVLLIYIDVTFSIITFVFDLFIFRPCLSLSSANSCSICCSSCGVLAHMSMSSVKRRWLRYSPSIFKPLVSQVSRQNMLSSAAVNNLGDMVSPCRTPLLMLILLLSLCRWTVIELLV